MGPRSRMRIGLKCQNAYLAIIIFEKLKTATNDHVPLGIVYHSLDSITFMHGPRAVPNFKCLTFPIPEIGRVQKESRATLTTLSLGVNLAYNKMDCICQTIYQICST